MGNAKQGNDLKLKSPLNTQGTIQIAKSTCRRLTKARINDCHRILNYCNNKLQQQLTYTGRIEANQCHSRPQSRDPSDLRQGSRALALSNTGSPRFTDFPLNLANRIGWEYEMNTLHMLRKSGSARALDPCRRSEGSWLWGREWTNDWWQILHESSNQYHHGLTITFNGTDL